MKRNESVMTTHSVRRPGLAQIVRLQQARRELEKVIAEAGSDPLWLVRGGLLKDVYALLLDVLPYPRRRRVHPPLPGLTDLPAPILRALHQAQSIPDQQSEDV